MLFKKCGPDNTEEVLQIALQFAQEKKINDVVIASTFGNTAELALEVLKDSKLNVVIVTHNTGFKNDGEQQFKEEIKNKILKAGFKIYSGTMPMRGLGRSIKNVMQFSHEEIIANTLRIFSQGVKVAIEIAVMAADSGLINSSEIISVAGTGRGADTVLHLMTKPANKFFEIKIKEIVAKPEEF